MSHLPHSSTVANSLTCNAPKTHPLNMSRKHHISCSSSLDSLTHTLDPIQDRLHINPPQKLSIWRAVLKQRYITCTQSAILNKNTQIHCTWRDKDYSRKPLHCDHDDSLYNCRASVPQQLLLSILQILDGNTKLLTITLYYTTGTIIIQGRACRQWVEQEFNRHREAVNAIDRHRLQTPSPTPLALEHQTTMDTNITNITNTKQLNAQSDQSLTQSDATDSIEPLNHNPHASIRQAEHSTTHSTDNTPSDQNVTDNIEHAEDEQLWEDVSDSQTKPKTRASTKHRRHTGMQGQRRLILQPLKMGSLNSELKQAKKQINKLTALYNELQDKISTQLETSNMQLKHGLKIHIDKKLEAQEEVITTLQTKVVKLTDHNNALKSQITDLKQELRAHKNKSTPSHKTPKDTPHKQQCQQNVQQCLDKTGAVQALQAVATTVSPTHDLSRAPPPPHHVRESLSSKTTSIQPTTPTSSTPRSAQTIKTSRQPTKTPREQLAECRVMNSTSHLLLGDSLLCPVRPDLMFPTTAHQKLAVPGLTVSDVVHWLRHVPRCREVRMVVVHVGINSCWENTLRESDWRHLVRLLKTVFPSSQLILSAIVPPAGHHPLGKTVAVSNTALATVCSSERVVLVDHTDTFTTNTGAPRKALYRDPLHASTKGTINLAKNICVHMKLNNNNSRYASGQMPPNNAWHMRAVHSGAWTKAKVRQGQPAPVTQRNRGPLLPTPQPSCHHHHHHGLPWDRPTINSYHPSPQRGRPHYNDYCTVV